MTPLVLTALICAAAPASGTASVTPSTASDMESTKRVESDSAGELEQIHYNLDNGLEVILAPDPRRRVAAVNVWYHVGADHEAKGQKGIAHLSEHLMFEGSANVATGDHVRHLRTIGVDALNAHTGRHRTRYLTSLSPEGLETLLWLEADRMGFLLEGLGSASFERERAVVIRELRERVDLAAYGLAEARLWRELFPAGHPYHTRIEGIADDLKALEFEDVREFIRTWYGPSNATIVVTGRFDPAQVRLLIDKYFSSLPAMEHPGPPSIEASELTSRVIVDHSEPVGSRAAVVVGWHAPAAGDDEAVLARVTAELLGSGGDGLMQKRLVRDLGLAARVSISLNEQAAQSVLRIRAVARPGVDAKDLLEAIDAVVADIEAGDVKPREVARARRRLSIRGAAAVDGALGLVEVAERVHRRQRGLAPASCVPAEALGTDAVAAFARNWLAPERSAVVLAKPAARHAGDGGAGAPSRSQIKAGENHD